MVSESVARSCALASLPYSAGQDNTDETNFSDKCESFAFTVGLDPALGLSGRARAGLAGVGTTLSAPRTTHHDSTS